MTKYILQMQTSIGYLPWTYAHSNESDAEALKFTERAAQDHASMAGLMAINLWNADVPGHEKLVASVSIGDRVATIKTRLNKE